MITELEILKEAREQIAKYCEINSAFYLAKEKCFPESIPNHQSYNHNAAFTVKDTMNNAKWMLVLKASNDNGWLDMVVAVSTAKQRKFIAEALKEINDKPSIDRLAEFDLAIENIERAKRESKEIPEHTKVTNSINTILKNKHK